MIKVHIHTDCYYFAGCENMLPPLVHELNSNPEFEFTFSYRKTKEYQEGLNRKIPNNSDFYPRKYPVYKNLTGFFPGLPKAFNWPFLGIWITIGNYLAMIYELLDLYLLFRRIKPEILHVNNGGYPGAASARVAIIAGKLAKVPVRIMVVNNMAREYNSFLRILDYPLDRLVARFATFFVSGSNSAMNQLTGVLDLPQNKRRVIPNGIEDPKKTFTDRSPGSNLVSEDNQVKFCVIAELVPRKGHTYLLQAIVRLRDAGKLNAEKFKLYIIGEGEAGHILKTFVASNHLEDLVFFEGYVNSVFSILESIDVVILPSIESEDFPFVIIEGLSLGKPVIGSCIAGIPEQIDHLTNGILVRPRNSEDLANAIEMLLNDEEMRRAMGLAGREKYLRCFTSEIAVGKYLELYTTSILNL